MVPHCNVIFSDSNKYNFHLVVAVNFIMSNVTKVKELEKNDGSMGLKYQTTN